MGDYLQPQGHQIRRWNIEKDKKITYLVILQMSKKIKKIQKWDLYNQIRIRNQEIVESRFKVNTRAFNLSLIELHEEGKIDFDKNGDITLA